MTNAIIIGAGGQIGSDLVPRLAAKGYRLTLVDRVEPETPRIRSLFDRQLPDLPWQDWWRVLDVTDAEAVGALIRDVEPDTVFHLAAVLSARCEAGPGSCWEVNMAGLRSVLDALCVLAEKNGTRPQLIWPSSIAAFGPPFDAPLPYQGGPDGPLNPQTMYGVTKVAGEVLGAYMASRQGIDFRSLRFPGLINTTEPGGGSSDYANAMYFAGARGQLEATSFVEASTRIPFMHMHDAVEALVRLASADESKLTRRIYNLRAFAAPSAAEIAASIADEVPGFSARYEPDYRQAIVDSWPDDFDDSAARLDWGWQAEVDTLQKLTRRLLSEIRALG